MSTDSQKKFYLEILEKVAFDLAKGSWENPETAMRVMRDTLIASVDHIQDEQIKAAVLRWRAMQRLGHERREDG